MRELLWTLIHRPKKKAAAKKGAVRKTAKKKTASRKTAHKKSPAPRSVRPVQGGKVAAPRPHTVAA